MPDDSHLNEGDSMTELNMEKDGGLFIQTLVCRLDSQVCCRLINNILEKDLFLSVKYYGYKWAAPTFWKAFFCQGLRACTPRAPLPASLSNFSRWPARPPASHFHGSLRLNGVPSGPGACQDTAAPKPSFKSDTLTPPLLHFLLGKAHFFNQSYIKIFCSYWVA